MAYLESTHPNRDDLGDDRSGGVCDVCGKHVTEDMDAEDPNVWCHEDCVFKCYDCGDKRRDNMDSEDRERCEGCAEEYRRYQEENKRRDAYESAMEAKYDLWKENR